MQLIKKRKLFAFTTAIMLAIVATFLMMALYLNIVMNANAVKISGKSVLFDGDSIARGYLGDDSTYCTELDAKDKTDHCYGYAHYLRDKWSMSATNVAVRGSKYRRPNGDSKLMSSHLTSAIKNTDFDFIILEGGTNDAHSSYFDTDNNYDEFKTAFKSYLNIVTTNEKWANSRIGFVIVPHPDYSRKTSFIKSEDKKLWKFVQDILDDYSIPYINFYKLSDGDSFVVPEGFDYDALTTKSGSADGLHPSKSVHKAMEPYIRVWMKELPNYKYNVSFNSNGSSLSGANKQLVIHGKKAVSPTYNVDSNQHFDYWSTSKNGSRFSFDTAVNSDTTLYAIWHVNVNLVLNGGRLPSGSNSFSISGGSAIMGLSSPTKEGYVFNYWSSDSNCSVRYNFGSAVNRDLTLYACFTERGDEDEPTPTTYTYALYYVLEGGSWGESQNIIEYNRTETTRNYTVTSIVPTRNGYIFKGWSDASGGVVKYHGNDPIVLSAENADANNVVSKYLYAIWEENMVYSYSINYYANGGIGGPMPQTGNFVDGQTVIVNMSDIPVRSGYIFLGWAYSPTAVAAAFPVDSGEMGIEFFIRDGVSQTEDLYAVWKNEDTGGDDDETDNTYIVSFDGNTNDIVDNLPNVLSCVSKLSYCLVDIPNTKPSREGYDFKYWVFNPDETVSDTNKAYAPGYKGVVINAIDDILYAVWEEDEEGEGDEQTTPEDIDRKTDNEDETDLPVSDASDVSGKNVPDTGVNTRVSDSGFAIFCVGPIVLTGIVIVRYFYRIKSKHRKFD